MEQKVRDCIVVRELPGYEYRPVIGSEGTAEECAAYIQRRKDSGGQWRNLTILNTVSGRLMSHIVR